VKEGGGDRQPLKQKDLWWDKAKEEVARLKWGAFELRGKRKLMMVLVPRYLKVVDLMGKGKLWAG